MKSKTNKQTNKKKKQLLIVTILIFVYMYCTLVFPILFGIRPLSLCINMFLPTQIIVLEMKSSSRNHRLASSRTF